MNPTLNSALNYAKDNFKVFPLKVNSKSGQVCKSWKEEATTDVNQIYQWFSNTDYNVGVRTGDGLVVIDVDNKNGKNGFDSMKQYLKGFPLTRIVKTPNNGWHIYYYVDRPIPCRVGIYESVDIRGMGGYVVGAESVIDGRKYFVSMDYPITYANDVVYKFLEGLKVPSKTQHISTTIKEGRRNDYLFRIGCFMQRKGLSDETIRVCLYKENEIKCFLNLSIKEVNQIVDSVLRYENGRQLMSR